MKHPSTHLNSKSVLKNIKLPTGTKKWSEHDFYNLSIINNDIASEIASILPDDPPNVKYSKTVILQGIISLLQSRSRSYYDHYTRGIDPNIVHPSTNSRRINKIDTREADFEYLDQLTFYNNSTDQFLIEFQSEELESAEKWAQRSNVPAIKHLTSLIGSVVQSFPNVNPKSSMYKGTKLISIDQCAIDCYGNLIEGKEKGFKLEKHGGLQLTAASFGVIPIMATLDPGNRHCSCAFSRVYNSIKHIDAIILTDAGYPSFDNLYLMDSDGGKFISRVKGNWARKNDFTKTRSKGISDAIVTLESAIEATSMTRTVSMKVRYIKKERSGREPVYFVTNIFDRSASWIVKCYRKRWAIENFFKHLKHGTSFRFPTKSFVVNLFYVLLLVYMMFRLAFHGIDNLADCNNLMRAFEIFLIKLGLLVLYYTKDSRLTMKLLADFNQEVLRLKGGG